MKSNLREMGQDKWFILALAGAIFLGPTSLAIFMPALPAIRECFGVDLQAAQLSLTLPLLAVLLTPMLVGRLVDRVGRRPVMMMCQVLVIFGCLMCVYAETYWALIAGRTLVGVFSSGCMIIGRAVVADVYSGPHLSRYAARFTIPAVLGIMLAPMLGGFLIHWYSWRETFWFVLLLSVALIVLAWFWLPETLRPIDAAQIDKLDVRRIFTSVPLMGFLGQSSFHFAVAFGFASIVPHIMVSEMGYDAIQYGYGLLVVVFALLFGLIVAERVVRNVTIGRMVLVASILGAAVSAGSTLFFYIWDIALSLTTLFLPAVFVAFTMGLALPFSQAGIVSTIEEQAGTASGISTALQMLLAAVFTHLFAIVWTMPHISIGFFSAVAMIMALGFSLLSRHAGSESSRHL